MVGSKRGLYFPNTWSSEYQTVISSNDEGEDRNEGDSNSRSR